MCTIAQAAEDVSTMDDIGMDDDNDNDNNVHMLTQHVDHMLPLPDGFQCEDIVDAFLTHGYSSTSYADVNQIGRLKSVSKLYNTAVKRLLSSNTTWLKPVTLEADMFKLTINNSLAETQYAEFFGGMRAARILPRMQEYALSALHTHMQTDGVVKRMQFSDNTAIAATASQRCCIVASVMRYHCCDGLIVGFNGSRATAPCRKMLSEPC